MNKNKMSNGDKLIASIKALEKIKREEQEQQIDVNNLIIKALNKQISKLDNENKNIMKEWM